MKKFIIIAVAFLPSISTVGADQSVKGYYRKDGTYVEPHYRSNPNQYRFDNYGAKNNYNPYTGEKGRDRHEFTNPPESNKPTPRNRYR